MFYCHSYKGKIVLNTITFINKWLEFFEVGFLNDCVTFKYIQLNVLTEKDPRYLQSIVE